MAETFSQIFGSVQIWRIKFVAINMLILVVCSVMLTGQVQALDTDAAVIDTSADLAQDLILETAPKTLDELELQELRLKRELLQQKLSLLEAKRNHLDKTSQGELLQDGISKLVNATSTSFHKERIQDTDKFEKSLERNKKERLMEKNALGERRTFEYV